MEKIENKKKYFIIGGISAVLIILAIVVVIVCNQPKEIVDVNTDEEQVQEEPKIKENTSEKIKAAKKFEELDITTATLTSSETSIEFVVNAKNNSETAIESQTLTFVFKDAEGNEMGKLDGFLSKVEPGEETKIVASGSAGMLIDADDYEVVKK